MQVSGDNLNNHVISYPHYINEVKIYLILKTHFLLSIEYTLEKNRRIKSAYSPHISLILTYNLLMYLYFMHPF